MDALGIATHIIMLQQMVILNVSSIFIKMDALGLLIHAHLLQKMAI
jgi:hypothetical protein